MSDVSMIGLGLTGNALARGLLLGGQRVTVWNRTPTKAALLVDEARCWRRRWERRCAPAL